MELSACGGVPRANRLPLSRRTGPELVANTALSRYSRPSSPPRVVVFHQFVNLSLTDQSCRSDQATLDILKLLYPLWEPPDVLDNVVQFAAWPFPPPDVHVPQLFVLYREAQVRVRLRRDRRESIGRPG